MPVNDHYISLTALLSGLVCSQGNDNWHCAQDIAIDGGVKAKTKVLLSAEPNAVQGRAAWQCCPPGLLKNS